MNYEIPESRLKSVIFKKLYQDLSDVEIIPPYYDSMIGKLITVAQTREEAINTMYRALSEYVIEGVKTTIPFHLQLMQNEDFRKGNFTTKFLETFKMK